MKEIAGSSPKIHDICFTHISGSTILQDRENLCYRCVLPTGHTGKCSKTFPIFKKSACTKKLIKKINNSIYTSLGNDDYVYINRASRLFAVVLSKTEEAEIRDKKEKKKCAIPLKDASTPILLAQAYLDWVTFVVGVHDISEYLITDGNQAIFEMLELNKAHLTRLFHNRKIFDDNGNTICVITKTRCNLADYVDTDRDIRTNIRDSDIQSGHNNSRDDNCVSIRGENLFPMSRRGNLIIGERVFTEDVWIDELLSIITSNSA
jgi:hypothetical protein